MTKSSIIKVFPATRCLPMLILRLCLMVWTYDLIASAESTQITHRICKNAVNSSVENICCQLIIDRDEYFKACTVNLTKPNSEEEMLNLVQLSKFTECLYMKRNYMKSSTQLNTAKVKAEANRLYHNDSLRKNFMIHTYRHCARLASENLEEVTKYPKSLENISQTHKPYFMFHYMCVVFYSKSKCPYFIWKGKDEDDKKKCTDFAAECVKNIEAQK